jgi:hypothetical protein
MKTKGPLMSGFVRQRVASITRFEGHSPIVKVVALVCAVLLGLSGGQRALAAVVFPPQGDDVTSSLGVFKIVVDPLFRPLLSPTGPPTSFVGYTGFHTSDGRLTSPMLYDSSTIIGRSNPNSRFYLFPQPLGAGSWDTILGYGDYPGIPFFWAAAPPPTEEVLTEIKTFVLKTINAATGQECTNTLVPTAPPNYPMVKAGTFAGVAPRSLGIVQENVANGAAPPDFPAHSFFDIFVEVNLPPLPGTESSVAFPPTGAVLTNGVALVVTNLNLNDFPPEVIYIHGGNTNAVPLMFKFDNPPYWAAGDLFGTLVLAGHGTFTNDCTSEAALAAAVLGTPSHPQPETPTAWLRPSNLCPPPGASYDSLLTDTNPPGGSDTIQFGIPGTAIIYARNFRHSNFPNPIPPPITNGTSIYTAPSTLIDAQVSVDGQNFFPATAQGPLVVKITDTTTSGSAMNTYDTEIVQMNLSGNAIFGSFMLRESPTLQSLGKHTIVADPRGYRISSFFDVFLEVSTDLGVTWIPADRSIRVQVSAPPPAPGRLFLSRTNAPGSLTMEWLGPSTLQSAAIVSGPYSDISGAGGSNLVNGITIPIGPDQKYFRLRQ